MKRLKAACGERAAADLAGHRGTVAMEQAKLAQKRSMQMTKRNLIVDRV